MALEITIRANSVSLSGKTQAKGGFITQDNKDGWVTISNPDSGLILREQITAITVDGVAVTDYDDLVEKAQELFNEGDTEPVNVVWDNITDKPTTFPPEAHTQAFTTITGVAEVAQIPALPISKTTGLQAALEGKLDAGDALQIGTTAGTAKDGAYQPTWGQVSGKPTTFAPSAHNHPFTEITGTAVAGQIPTLAISKISGLQGALDGKLDAVEGAAVADAVDETEVVAQFNALLASLRAAGVIAT